ncbi:MAG: hypothetical protein KGO50_17480 [Myxococcales bacterium]|nr:hypothetical protein [Myxococcales bacterium]
MQIPTTRKETMHTQTRIEAGKDRYGAYLMIGDFRSAMPSIEIAKQLAVAPTLLESLEGVVALIDADARIGESRYVTKARAAIAAARGEGAVTK